MKIKIKASDYHLFIESTDEHKSISNLIKELNIDKNTYYNVITKLKNEYPNEYKEEYYNCCKAILKFIKDDTFYTSLMAKTQYVNNFSLPFIKKNMEYHLNNYIDYLIDNKNFYSSPGLYLYEPVVATSLYLTNKMYHEFRNVKKNYINGDNIKIDIAIQLLRAIRSSFVLYSIGDDNHGLSLYRGILELFIRIFRVENYLDDFLKFTNLNSLLQEFKQKGKLKKEDQFKLDSFLKDNHLTYDTAENFLLYGWAKNNGKRIRTQKEFIESGVKMLQEKGFIQNIDNWLNAYHISCEFIHEDYLYTKYDYPLIRLLGTRVIVKALSVLYDEMKKYLSFDFNEEYYDTLLNRAE